jgi:hypothetical protein
VTVTRFTAILELNGKTATGLEVPPSVVDALGGGKRPPVHVTIGGYAFRTTIAPMGGQYWIGVSAAHRAAAGIEAGQQLDIEVTLDDQPRDVATPDDLAAALAQDPQASACYDRLSYTHRKEWVRWIEEAKKPETRQARLEKTIASLRTGKRSR